MAGRAGRFVQKTILIICSALAIILIVPLITDYSVPPLTYKISDQDVSSKFMLWFGEHLLMPEKDVFDAEGIEEFARRIRRHLHHWWFGANLQSGRVWIWARTVY